MCENVSNICLLTAPSVCLKLRTCWREWDSSWQFSVTQQDYFVYWRDYWRESGCSVCSQVHVARVSNGNRLFTSFEFLVSQQPLRVASKRTLKNHDGEWHWRKPDRRGWRRLQCAKLNPSRISLNHLISYDGYNICEIIAESKPKFGIQMLLNICKHFDIPINEIKVTKRAPHVERLITLGKKMHLLGKSLIAFC